MRVARKRLDRASTIAGLLETWDCESKIIQKWWADSTTEKKRFKALIEPLHADFCAAVVQPFLAQWKQYVYRLYQNGLEMGVALNEDGQEQAGMGLGIGDFNLDGTLGILKTNFIEDTAALYAYRGKRGFEDVTMRSGLGVETRYVNWGAAILDLDNDGYPDLFWVTGSVYPEVEKKFPEYPHKTPRVLFRNLGNGKFEELLTEGGPAVNAAHAAAAAPSGISTTMATSTF